MLNTVTTSASALLLALLGGNIGPALPEAGAAEPAAQDTDTAAVTQEAVPADDALADGAEIDASTPEVVESHEFSGSGTAAAAFQEWFDGGEFTEPEAQTFDLVQLDVPGGETAEAGDTIAKFADGSFGVIKQDTAGQHDTAGQPDAQGQQDK